MEIQTSDPEKTIGYHQSTELPDLDAGPSAQFSLQSLQRS